MNIKPTQPSSKPLPSLPTEIKHQILRFCDPSTLAITSQVSLPFLDLSSPILYQDIEIVGLENVEKLFCSRGEEDDDGILDHPHLHPYLNLIHIRTLTIVATEEASTGDKELNLRTTRLPPIPSSSRASTPSLSVDLLVLRPVGIDIRDDAKELERWTRIYEVLDPKMVHLVGQRNSLWSPVFNFYGSGWTHLLELHIAHATSARDDCFIHAFQGADPSLVVLDLSSSSGSEMSEDTFRTEMVYEMQPDAMETGVNVWVVRVGSEREKGLFRKRLKAYWKRQGITDWEVELDMERVRFELVPSTFSLVQ